MDAQNHLPANLRIKARQKFVEKWEKEAFQATQLSAMTFTPFHVSLWEPPPDRERYINRYMICQDPFFTPPWLLVSCGGVDRSVKQHVPSDSAGRGSNQVSVPF